MPNQLTVYRVQDLDGRGPWRPGFSDKWMDADIGDRANLKPWPLEFGLKILNRVLYGQSVGCGCRSLAQLWKWFSRPEMDRLHVLGYHIVKIEDVSVLAESDVQLVFTRNRPLNEAVEIIE